MSCRAIASLSIVPLLVLGFLVGCSPEPGGDGDSGDNTTSQGIGDSGGTGTDNESDNRQPSPSTPTGETMTLSLGGGVTMELVRIPAGTFMMGTEHSKLDEQPVHSVTISRDFWLGRYEVTEAQYNKVMGTDYSGTVCSGDVADGCPAGNLSWDDAVAFTEALKSMSGQDIRLPTEAEWEYACRAGTTTVYYFGDEGAELDDYAWYSRNGGVAHPVGQKIPNDWGLYDMLGNMWEFCSDQYHWAYYSISPSIDPMGPTPDGLARSLRGGSFILGALDVRSGSRSAARYSHGAIGFRVAAGT